MALISSHLKANCYQMINYLQSKFIQMRLSKLLSFPYQTSKSVKLKHFANLNKLSTSIEKEAFFIRENQKQIGAEIQTLIRAQQWYLLKKGLSMINIAELDSWLTLRKIGTTFTYILNSEIDTDFMDQDEIQNMTHAMGILRYEPVFKTGGNQSNYEYDNIENFERKMRNYFQQLDRSSIDKGYLNLASRLLHTNPELFLNKRQELESYILNSIQRKQFFQGHLLHRGCISDYWTQQFRKKVITYGKKTNNHKQIWPLLMADKNTPTTIEPSNEQTRIKTESDIGNILQGYHYDMQPNMRVNSFEVDFLISGILAVEYNGPHHYVINSPKLVPTRKQEWRTEMLNQRGIIVSSIPYTEFKYIKHFEDKRLYLVNKIESDLIHHRRILK